MYNGQPPFRPPFPPNLPPGNGTPNFPPFPPNGQAFTPPPFPPNFSPGMTPPGYGGNTPGFRPPPGSIPPRPAHPGLGAQAPGSYGLPPAPTGLPRPPSFGGPGGAPPGFRKEVKTTKVFVGAIAPGISDETMHHLLNACGPLHELNRVVGASGKPQAFGFAAFESPEVVMRCIRCLNGVELPDMTPEGRREGKKKALVVKADDKTREFLEEFESTLGRSEDEENADAACRRSIAHIVALLTDPNAQAPAGFVRPAGGQSPINVVVPAHLQDLKEGDLPENQRVAVLDQIAIFRVNAAKREREKQRMDVEKERQKLEEQATNPRGATGNYGYGNRGLESDRQKRQWGQPSNSPNNERNGRGSFSGGQSDPKGTPIGRGDAQGYDKPVNFVRPETSEGKADSERTDEEEEELRQQRLARERDHAFRDRERRVEDKERRRIDGLNREAARRRQDAENESRQQRRQAQIFENWDDDEKIEQGRDWFYTDRSRWRSARQQARNREYQDDLRDRHREDDERRKLEAESEEFLKRQMAELAEMEEKQKARGLLTEDAAPIKLAMSSAPISTPKETKKAEPAVHKPNMAFDEDDELEAAGVKKKRTLVKLEYDGPAPLGEEISEAERIARRNAKLLEVKRMVPDSRRAVWSYTIEWDAFTDALVQDKIKPFVRSKMKDLLGEVDEDLADFVIEHLRDKKGPDDLVEGLEPVFAEEASVFVNSLWRQLVFESAAFKVGVESGTMLV